MRNSLFEKYLSANKRFFRARAERLGSHKHSLYVDAGTNNGVVLNATLHFAMAIAETEKLRLVVMATRHGTRHERRIIHSFVSCRIVTTFGTMITGCLTSAIGVWRCFSRVRAGRALVRLRFGGHPIGQHVYDQLLRRHGLSSLGVLSAKTRLEIAAEVAYYFGLKRMFDQERFAFAILSDIAYRQGTSFEILRHRVIPCLCAIDLNGVAAHLYRTSEHYAHHCRTPDFRIVQALNHDPAIQSAAAQALAARMSGVELQPDVVRAYGAAKRIPAAEELRRSFGATDGRKLVLVMAHIFQDAPHGYPNAYFRDYRHWLIETCRRLENNPNVSLVVKEHPSVDLYREEGVIDQVLSELGSQRVHVVKDINTKSFFGCADVVLTCGGTCGIEFPCFGVPVVVAARPPYSEFSYIHRPPTRREYFSLLDNIHAIPRLTEEQIHLARTVFYVLQTVQKVAKSDLGLGTQGYILGQPADESKAWEEMIAEVATGTGFTRLVKYIHLLLASDLSNALPEAYLTSFRPASASSRSMRSLIR